MKNYVMRNDWEYDCVEEEIIPKQYAGISLSLGMKFKKLPALGFIVGSKTLPDSIPNHHKYLIFNSKIRDIISAFNTNDHEYFDVTIFDEKKNLVSSDYKVMNILQVVDCIDRKASTLEINQDDEIDDITDLRLKYDSIKADTVLFRLEGFETLLLVREDLAQAIVNAHCTGLEFYEAEGFRI